MCPWPTICFHGPLGQFLDLLPPASLPPVQKRDAQHMFLQPVCSQKFMPINPSPPNQQNEGFALEFLLEGPQTELRTLSQNCEQNPPKNANKQNCEQTGVFEKGHTHTPRKTHLALVQDPHLGNRKLSGPVRDTPPYRAIPFRDSIAEGGIAPICLVFIGYRGSIADIPLLRGGIAPLVRMYSKGGTLRKGGGGIAPNWPW